MGQFPLTLFHAHNGEPWRVLLKGHRQLQEIEPSGNISHEIVAMSGPSGTGPPRRNVTIAG